MDYFNEMNLITSVFKPLILHEANISTAKEVRIAVFAAQDNQGVQRKRDTISNFNLCKGKYKTYYHPGNQA